MKKIFLSFMILSMLCASASAHIIYTTQEGKLGLIKVNGTGVNSIDLSGTQYAGGGKGSVVAPYWENNTSNGAGNSKIILITPKESGDTSVSGDTAVRFSSSESLSNPIDEKPINLTGTYGTPVICGTRSGGSLYLATGATMREYKTKDFSLYNSYTYASSDSAPNPEIKSVIKNDANVYVLVGLGNTKIKTGTNFSNDVVVQLEGTFKSPVAREIKTSSDAYTMDFLDFLSDTKIAVGCEDGVYHLQSSSTTSLVSSDAPVIALHQDTGSGFYYATVSSDQNVRLYHYTTSNTKPEAFLTASGDKAKTKIIKDSEYNVLGVITSDEISIITMSNDTYKTFNSTVLGGVPISIAASSTTGNSADTSSGCMIGGAGLALMAALIFTLRHKEAD